MLVLMLLGVSAFAYSVIRVLKHLASTDQARELRDLRKRNGTPEWLERTHSCLMYGGLWSIAFASFVAAVVIVLRSWF